MSEKTPSQQELEAPVKGYQLEAVRQELRGMKGILEKIENNTKGVVTQSVMEVYVEKRINEKIKPLIDHKNSSIWLNRTLLTLVIGLVIQSIWVSLFGSK